MGHFYSIHPHLINKKELTKSFDKCQCNRVTYNTNKQKRNELRRFDIRLKVKFYLKKALKIWYFIVSNKFCCVLG